MPVASAALLHRRGAQRPSGPGSMLFRRMSSTSTSIMVTEANPEKSSMLTLLTLTNDHFEAST